MNKLFPFLFLFISIATSAQNDIKTISGQILDKKTKEPIAFASIYIKKKAIGTTSNE